MRLLTRIMLRSFLLAAVACGSDSSNGDASESAGMTGGVDSFKIFPDKIFSGYDDGTNTYKAPVIAHFTGKEGAVTWKVSDESIASVASDGPNAMLTMKKAGKTMVTATSGGKVASASLTVYQYTREQHEAGAARYAKGPNDDNPPCVLCHGQMQGVNRPNHTPTEVDADGDPELQNTFVTGKDPEGRPIAEMSEFAALLNGKKHMWQVTEIEKKGLLSYLRSLEPLGYPEYDAPTDDLDHQE